MSAIPPPYVREASFTNFSTEPAPTVGQDLEAEFNAIKLTADRTQSRLAEIQRDDGQLRNLSVHPDALNGAVRALLAATGDIEGDWGTGLIYTKADVVRGPDGITYLAAVDHVATAVFADDLAAGRWLAIDSAGALDELLRADLAAVGAGQGAAAVGYGAGTVKTRLDALGNLRADLAATNFALGLLLNGTAAGAAINQLRTGQHFAQNGARIHRLNDRVFVGAATQNDGAFPADGRCWMDDLWVAGGFGTGPGASALMYIANDTDPNNAIGLISAVQTKDFTNTGTTGIGGFSCVFNNHASLATKAYGHYIEAHRTTASPADTYGLEIDTRTLKAAVQPTPRQLTDVTALQLASGAEWSATGQFDGGAAIQMAANPKKFWVGINVMHDALVDIGGGVTQVMNMNRYGLLSWFDATGARSGWVTSSATAAATGTTLDLRDNQVNISGISGGLQFAFVGVTAPANYLSFYSAVSTGDLRILAGGTDTNVNISIEPLGSGCVRVPIAKVREAADDAAAAALSPPVPVGGHYRTGSALKIRAA